MDGSRRTKTASQHDRQTSYRIRRPIGAHVAELRSVLDRASTQWERIRQYLNRPPDLENQPFLQRVGASILRTVRGVVIDLYEGQLDLRAMSLVYSTLLSLVPLLAISFSVLKGFGVHNQIEPLLLNLLAPLGEKAEEITNQVIEFVDNARVGILGFVGFAFLFYIVISLMHKIELAFNYVWRTDDQRTWPKRIRDYLAVIIVGPLLVLTALGVITTIVSAPAVRDWTAHEPVHWFLELFQSFVPTVMLVAAFTFMYMFMPVARVRFRAAFAGGLVTGVLWYFMGWFFGVFIASSSNYAAIYTSFATPIVFMVWLYFNWLLLLIGASIAFYIQHPEYAAHAGREMKLTNQMKERLAVLAAAEIGRTFYSKTQPPTLEDLARRLGIPAQGMGHVLQIMEDGGLLRRSAGIPVRYVPAQPWDTTTLNDLLDVVRGTQSNWNILDARTQADHKDTITLLDEVERALKDAAGHTTLKALSLTGRSQTSKD